MVRTRYDIRDEWTCEGKLKSVNSEVGATDSNRYIGACMLVHGRAHPLEDEYRWHRRWNV